MKKMIEGKFKAESEANRLANLKQGDKKNPRSGDFSGSEKGDTRDKIAKAIGIGCSFTTRHPVTHLFAPSPCARGDRGLGYLVTSNQR
jgi:hypothetical protein